MDSGAEKYYDPLLLQVITRAPNSLAPKGNNVKPAAGTGQTVEKIFSNSFVSDQFHVKMNNDLKNSRDRSMASNKAKGEGFSRRNMVVLERDVAKP